MGCVNQSTQSTTEKKYTTTTITPKVTIQEITQSEYIKDSISVSYDDLFRNNEQYIGKKVHFQGKIIQMISYGNNFFLFRIAVFDAKYPNSVILVWYSGQRFLEEDVVEFWGTVNGVENYETVLGQQVSAPSINAKYLGFPGTVQESMTIQPTSTQKPIYQDEYFLKESVSLHNLDSQKWIKMRDFYYRGDYQSAMVYASGLLQTDKECDDTVKDVVGNCVDDKTLWRGKVSPNLYSAQQEYLSGKSNLQKAAFSIYSAAWGLLLDPEVNSPDKQISTAKKYLADARSQFNSANGILSDNSYQERYSTNWMYF